MATMKTISAALNLIDTKKENLKTAFENLQSQSSFHHSIPLSWIELDSHFSTLQKSLNNRFEILQSLEHSHSQSQSKTLISNPKDENFSVNPTYPSSSRNKLRVLCEKVDGIGLRNYILDNFKDRIRIQAELIEEFQHAPDAGEMVLQSLEGFYVLNGKFNDKGLSRMGRICNTLLRLLGVAGVNVSSKVKEKALKVALEWKARMRDDYGNIVGALGFFYLVYGFGILSEFSMDELVEYAARAAVNGEFMKLCRDIGMTDRVPEIVQKLVDRGKHVQAVKYVFEFNLAHKIPPVPILKAGVEEAKQLSGRLSEEGKPRREIISRELHTLKSIIAVIENHKLESEYPRASLDQRIKQMKGHDANMKDRTPASILNQHPLQQQRKRSMEQQQQNESKLPRTSTSVGPAAVLKNITGDNSTICQYQQPPVNPSGPSAGTYGFAGIPIGPNLGGSHMIHSSEPHMPSAYGGINLRHHHQKPYYPQ
ncbi:unnamed protein product [Trifolium pratense]|uniref:Uncharacterized protein n=1 Tax=Trifolium pratense TaxID=57577 RepID=A0ACB0J8C3_TRIPR|nr:unnamed protein product [Trifolium pratense]